MSFTDFCRQFHIVTICRVMNTSFFKLGKAWSESVFHSFWRGEERSGGGPDKNTSTFLNNPQVRVTAALCFNGDSQGAGDLYFLWVKQTVCRTKFSAL